MTNFSDRTIWTGDNLDILRGLNSASVNLVFPDPPFNAEMEMILSVLACRVGPLAGSRGHRNAQLSR